MLNIVIIGAGVTGNVFLKALIKSGDAEITITDRAAEKLNLLRIKHSDIKTSQDNALAVNAADWVILAVKPQSFLELAAEIKGKISSKGSVAKCLYLPT